MYLVIAVSGTCIRYRVLSHAGWAHKALVCTIRIERPIFFFACRNSSMFFFALDHSQKLDRVISHPSPSSFVLLVVALGDSFGLLSISQHHDKQQGG